MCARRWRYRHKSSEYFKVSKSNRSLRTYNSFHRFDIKRLFRMENMEGERYEAIVQSWRERQKSLESQQSMSEENANRPIMDVKSDKSEKDNTATGVASGVVGSAVPTDMPSVDDKPDKSDKDSTISGVSAMQREDSAATDTEGENLLPRKDNDNDNYDSSPSPKKDGADVVIVNLKTDQHDKMDGVYVRGVEKQLPNTEEENNCEKHILDCLYFSMQCCQCTLS